MQNVRPVSFRGATPHQILEWHQKHHLVGPILAIDEQDRSVGIDWATPFGLPDFLVIDREAFQGILDILTDYLRKEERR